MSGLYSTDHLLALLTATAFAASLTAAARHRSLGWTQLAARALSVVLIADEVGWWVYLINGHHRLDLAYSLPLQLCDVTILVAAVALWRRTPLFVELTYFWGLAGSVQALLTPDLPDRFPSFLFFQYYIAHGGVVAAALFLVVGLRLQPRPGSVWRVTAITLAYTAFVGVVDAVTGGNYMYLRSKPPALTALDLLGPWPWYLGAAASAGLLLLLLLDAPFRMPRRRG
jgi:hypothetical integral membrane protein (TIGR02206 family)